jgi:hypothetical protein
MLPAALGFRVHSGWAAVIASSSTFEVVHRGIVRIVDESMAGAVQPYHFVEHWDLKEAEKHIRLCTERTAGLAQSEMEAVLAHLTNKGYQVTACGLLTGSGRPLGSLQSILAAHPLIHTAEGVFFRDAIRAAAQHLGLSVVEAKEKEVSQASIERFGPDVPERLKRIGKQLGPPWRQDEQLATLASWLAIRLS